MYLQYACYGRLSSSAVATGNFHQGDSETASGCCWLSKSGLSWPKIITSGARRPTPYEWWIASQNRILLRGDIPLDTGFEWIPRSLRRWVMSWVAERRRATFVSANGSMELSRWTFFPLFERGGLSNENSITFPSVVVLHAAYNCRNRPWVSILARRWSHPQTPSHFKAGVGDISRKKER